MRLDGRAIEEIFFVRIGAYVHAIRSPRDNAEPADGLCVRRDSPDRTAVLRHSAVRTDDKEGPYVDSARGLYLEHSHSVEGFAIFAVPPANGDCGSAICKVLGSLAAPPIFVRKKCNQRAANGHH
jgi:hypothetical protein